MLLACLSRLASPLCALDFFHLLPNKSIMLQLLSVLWALCCGDCVENTRAFGKELRSLVWWVVWESMLVRRSTWSKTSCWDTGLCNDCYAPPGKGAFSQSDYVSHRRQWFPRLQGRVCFCTRSCARACKSVREISSASGYNIGWGDSRDGAVLISRAADTSQTPPDVCAGRRGRGRSTLDKMVTGPEVKPHSEWLLKLGKVSSLSLVAVMCSCSVSFVRDVSGYPNQWVTCGCTASERDARACTHIRTWMYSVACG